jgi:hypothetical protein
MAELAQRIEARRDGPAYGQDWAAWARHQADLLKARRFDQLDLENLLDEVESLAARDFKAWVAAIRLVLMHMLKWDHQPSHRVRSWIVSIVRERGEIEDGLEASPSYAARVDEALSKAYRAARRDAAAETNLPIDTFPKTCPYDWTDITAREHSLHGDEA